MTTSRLPLLGLALALAATLAIGAAPADTPADEITLTSATHTVSIRYLETRGLYRRAQLKIEPVNSRAPAPWRGSLRSIYIEGLRDAPSRDVARAREAGFPRFATFLSSGHTTGSNVYAPAPENLKRLWLRPQRGSALSIRIWTEHHNPSTYGDDDGGNDGGDKPKDPDDGDGDDGDGDGDDGDDGDDDGDDGCENAASCTGIINPWTCECDEDIIDPWGDEARTEGATTSFGF